MFFSGTLSAYIQNRLSQVSDRQAYPKGLCTFYRTYSTYVTYLYIQARNLGGGGKSDRSPIQKKDRIIIINIKI